MRKTLTHIMPALAYMALLAYYSLTPAPHMPEVRHIDKVYHFAAYSVMGFLWARVFAPKSPIAFSALVGAGYGALIEVVQGFTPSRSPEFMDGVVNALGAFTGAFLYTRVADILKVSVRK